MSLSLLIRDFFIGDLTKEVSKMSQAINDRLDQLTATMEAEKAEIAASLQALRDEIAQGRLDEAAITRRLDESIQSVKDMHTPESTPVPGGGGGEEPNPIP